MASLYKAVAKEKATALSTHIYSPECICACRPIYYFIIKSDGGTKYFFGWSKQALLMHSYCSMQKTEKWERKFRIELVKQLVGQVRDVRERKKTQYDMEKQLNGKLNIMYPMEDRKIKDSVVCSDHSGVGTQNRRIFFCKTCSF